LALVAFDRTLTHTLGRTHRVHGFSPNRRFSNAQAGSAWVRMFALFGLQALKGVIGTARSGSATLGAIHKLAVGARPPIARLQLPCTLTL